MAQRLFRAVYIKALQKPARRRMGGICPGPALYGIACTGGLGRGQDNEVSLFYREIPGLAVQGWDSSPDKKKALDRDKTTLLYHIHVFKHP